MAATSDDFDFSICAELTHETTLPQSGLTEYNYQICQTSIKECYSAFDQNINCDYLQENQVFELVLLEGSQDVIIPVSPVNSYNYEPPVEQISKICLKPGWGVGLIKDAGTEQSIRADGAYAINKNQCIALASSFASNNTIFETNNAVGPLVGSYYITYGADSVTGIKVKNISFTDTYPPVIRISTTDLAIPPLGLTYTDGMIITDNYLAEYPDMIVTAELKNDQGASLGNVINFTNTSETNSWISEYSVHSDTTSILYTATDVPIGNVSTATRLVIPAPVAGTLGLRVIATDALLYPSSSSSYAYSENSEVITKDCLIHKLDPAAAWQPDTGTYDLTSTVRQVVDALGAYAISDDNCIASATRIVSNGTIFETNPAQGPLIGSHTITYKYGEIARVINIQVTDNINPTISIQGLSTIQTPPAGVNYTDTVTVTDNYLPAYTSINVKAIIKDAYNNILATNSMTNISGNSWSVNHQLPVAAKKIEYTAQDSSGNLSTIAFRTITPAPANPTYLMHIITNDTTINPSASTSYNYTELSSVLNSVCNSYEWSNSGVYILSPVTSSPNLVGAYVISSNGCIYETDRAVSNGTIFETNPQIGPLLGSYTVTYSSNLVAQPVVATIIVEDITAPQITADTSLLTMSSSSTHSDSVSVTDNYLSGYGNISVNVSFTDTYNLRVGATNPLLRQSASNNWAGSYDVPENATKIIYTAIDQAGNSSSVSRPVTTPPKSCTIIYSSNTINASISANSTCSSGATYVSGTDLKIVINSGVMVYSTNVNVPALNITGITGSITMVNNGSIYGAGGKGGNGGTGDESSPSKGQNGSDGGNAIHSTVDFSPTGTVGGGGGGGGGSAGVGDNDWGDDEAAAGAGGGGGFPFGVGGAKGGCTHSRCDYNEYATAGETASGSAAGAGGNGGRRCDYESNCGRKSGAWAGDGGNGGVAGGSGLTGAEKRQGDRRADPGIGGIAGLSFCSSDNSFTPMCDPAPEVKSLSGSWNTSGFKVGCTPDSASTTSNTITHRQSTTEEVIFTMPISGSYNWNVSSEARYDFINIYHDGSRVVRDSGSRSGTINFTNVTKFQFQYTKDGSVNRYSDNASITNFNPIASGTDVPIKPECVPPPLSIESISGDWIGVTGLVVGEMPTNASLRSKNIGNNQRSTQYVNFTAPASGSYNWVVSSEGNYDYLNVYHNGSRVVRQSGYRSGSQSFSGISSLKFEFYKDGSVTRGSDDGYISNFKAGK